MHFQYLLPSSDTALTFSETTNMIGKDHITTRTIKSSSGQDRSFYRGIHLGLGGIPFPILEFRTMREDSAGYADPPFTVEENPRLTPLDKWLSDTELNEIHLSSNLLEVEFMTII